MTPKELKALVEFNVKMGIKCACNYRTGMVCMIHDASEVINWQTDGKLHQLCVRFVGKFNNNPIQMIYQVKDKRMKTEFIDIPKDKLSQFLKAVTTERD